MTTEPAKRGPGRPPKQRTNPECSNPACLVTCAPDCPNLHDMIEQEEYRQSLKGDDPTIGTPNLNMPT